MVNLGIIDRGTQVSWDPASLVNGHMFVAGMSGAGKSHFLRRFALHVAASRTTRVHIYDIHGDLGIEGESMYAFTEQSPYGLNPLIVNPDPEFGGVRKCVQTLIAILGKTARQLGPKQEAVLRALLFDLYAANGFYPDNPVSWRLDDGEQRRWPKKHPTFDDAWRFASTKLKSLYLGGLGARTTSAIVAVEKRSMEIRKLKIQMKDDPDPEKIQLAQEKAREAFEEFITTLDTGREVDELIKYDSKETLKSVVDRLDNLRGTGLFKGVSAPFDPNSYVWRRKLNSLSLEERKLFVLLDLQQKFREAVQRGESKTVRDLIVVDETPAFIDDDPENPIAIIVKEARKFGVAIVLAAQNPNAIPDDVLSSMGTKVILKLDDMFLGSAGRRLGVEPDVLKRVKPKETALVQRKRPGDASNLYEHILLAA